MNAWEIVEWHGGRVTYQHVRTGQRIEMPEYLETPPAEWMAEWNRKTCINGPGNGQDGRQA